MARRSLVPRGSDEVTWHPFSRLQRAINDMMHDFPGELSLQGNGEDFTPRVDLSEDDKAYHIKAELPGVDQKDVDISLSNGAPVIRGEKKSSKEEKKQDYYRQERFFGSFFRSIPLPSEVIRDEVQASFNDGVLTVDLPKSEQAKADQRKIPISSGR